MKRAYVHIYIKYIENIGIAAFMKCNKTFFFSNVLLIHVKQKAGVCLTAENSSRDLVYGFEYFRILSLQFTPIKGSNLKNLVPTLPIIIPIIFHLTIKFQSHAKYFLQNKLK